MDLFAETEVHYRNVYRNDQTKIGRAYHVDAATPVAMTRAMVYRIKVYPKTEAIKKFRERRQRKIAIRFVAAVVAVICALVLVVLL